MFSPAFLADALVVIHLAIVLYGLFGTVAIVVGGLFRARWVRNPLFRWTHLALLAFVAIQAAAGKLCFLTIWEVDLRVEAGQTPSELSFVGRVLREVLYVEAEQSTLTAIYIGVAITVVFGMILVPPRRPSSRPGAPGEVETP